jgi:general secretion pathway protein G
MVKKSAFTLLEIMIAVLIIGVMMAIVGPPVYRWFARAKETATQQSLEGIKQAIVLYNNDMSKYPSSREGLEVLIEAPSPRGGWRGPYLEKSGKALKDGFGNDFEYNNPPVKYKKEYRNFEIISYGSGGEDDDGLEFHTGN